jgi:hypothetical protein
MKTATPLSKEQKKAKDLYMETLIPAAFVGVLFVNLLPLVLLTLLQWLHLYTSPRGHSSLAGLTPVGLLLGHLWAVRRVRQSEFSLELKTSETVFKTASEFRHKPMEWCYPKTKIGVAAKALFLFFASAACWWLWHDNNSSAEIGQALVGFIGFWIGLAIGIHSLIFFRTPRFRLDEKGVSGVQSLRWLPHVAWSQIASCEIKRFRNFSAESTARWFLFKNAQGKIVFNLDPFAMQGLSADEVEQIEVEIKNWMKG